LTAEERSQFDEYMAGFSAGVEKLFGVRGAPYNYPHAAMISVVMQVDEVFEQTPKKGTGLKVV
jgi:hypothetical protein